MSEKNIYQRMLAVSNAVRTVEKNMTVGAGTSSSYKAVSDFDVTLAVKKAEYEFGIKSFPISTLLMKQEAHQLQLKDRYGNDKIQIQYVDEVHMIMRFVNVDKPEEYVEVEGYGRGIDTADKSFGKASTYARKYCLLNAYMIATGEDPDKDLSPSDKDEEPEKKEQKPAAKKAVKKAESPAPQPEAPAPQPEPLPAANKNGYDLDQLLRDLSDNKDLTIDELKKIWHVNESKMTAEDRLKFMKAVTSHPNYVKPTAK